MFEPCVTDSTKLLDTSLTVAVDATETADNMTPQPAIKGVMTGGAAPALSNIESLTINSADSFVLGDITGLVFSISGHRSVGNVSTGSPLSQVVEKALDSAKDILTGLSVDANLTDKLNLAFGENWNGEMAANLIQDFATSDFSKLPKIEILTSTQINGANGAFAAAIDKIYLSQEFVAKNAVNAEAIKSVILEEAGHFIDSRINTKDAAGDEGEIFAGVVQGKTFDAAGLANLKAEDDSTTLNLDGQKYLAEMNNFVIQGSIGNYYYRSDNSTLRSLLGAPTSNEFQVTNGWRQNFEGGSIFHSSRGTFVARGSVGNYYLKLGGEKSLLGLPTSNEFQVTNGWRQNFEGGAIFHSGAGSYTIRGSLGNYYLNNLGGEKSQLGLPTSNEFSTAYGARQNFERGYVDWWNTGKGTFTLNSSPLVSSTQQANSFFKLQYWSQTYNSSGPNGSTNCGPASLAMIRKMFGMEQANISVETSIDHTRYLMFGYSNGTSQGVTILNQDTVWTSFDNVKNGIKNSGGTPEELTGWDNLDRSLVAGKPVINYGTLTNTWRQQFPSRVGNGSGGHWNAILGKTSDGKYIVADPMHEGGTVAMTKTQLSVFNANPKFIAFARK